MMKDRKLQKAWVKALRSGKYKQGRSALRTGRNEYCCLGVLCRVAGLKFRKTDEDAAFPSCVTYKSEQGELEEGIGLLPYHLRSHLGLTDGQQARLAHMNDGKTNPGGQPSHRKTFAQIADYVEAKL